MQEFQIGDQDLGQNIESIYLKDVNKKFRDLKSQAERALVQVRDEELPVAINEGSNSITVLMKHISGNMIHLWTEPLAPLEEKPPRKRDEEFIVLEDDTKVKVFERWEEAWSTFFKTLSLLTAEDLTKNMTHARRTYTLLEGLNLQFVHYGEHIGQIISLAKYFRGKEWKPIGFI